MVALATVSLVLSLTGCGSGGGEETAEARPRLTEGRLARRMGNVCQEHTDRQVIAIERFDKEHGYPTEPAAKSPVQLEQELVQVILPIIRDNIHDLEVKVRPPVSQEANFKAFLKALEHGIEASEADPSWVVAGRPEPFQQARNLSGKLGTAFCGQA